MAGSQASIVQICRQRLAHQYAEVSYIEPNNSFLYLYFVFLCFHFHIVYRAAFLPNKLIDQSDHMILHWLIYSRSYVEYIKV